MARLNRRTANLLGDRHDPCCADEKCSAKPIVHTPVDDCCAAKGDEIAALGAHADVRKVLIIVLTINLVMFMAELSAGIVARSTSLMADSVDMLGDALVYILSLYAQSRSPLARWSGACDTLQYGLRARAARDSAWFSRRSWHAQVAGVHVCRLRTCSREIKVAEITPIVEFKFLLADLETAHRAFQARLPAEAPALVDDYAALTKLTWRVLVSALGVGTTDGSSG